MELRDVSGCGRRVGAATSAESMDRLMMGHIDVIECWYLPGVIPTKEVKAVINEFGFAQPHSAAVS